MGAVSCHVVDVEGGESAQSKSNSPKMKRAKLTYKRCFWRIQISMEASIGIDVWAAKQIV